MPTHLLLMLMCGVLLSVHIRLFVCCVLCQGGRETNGIPLQYQDRFLDDKWDPEGVVAVFRVRSRRAHSSPANDDRRAERNGGRVVCGAVLLLSLSLLLMLLLFAGSGLRIVRIAGECQFLRRERRL